MVETRPESVGYPAIRELVTNVFGASDVEDGAQHARSPRGIVHWPEGEIDLTTRHAMSASRATFAINSKREYRIGDFTRHHDRAFIVAAYMGLLERQPDSAGFAHYVGMIRRGYAKIEVLGRLRYSGEGKRVGASVPSLKLRYPLAVASRLPVLGPVLGVFDLLIRSTSFKRSIRRIEAHMAQLSDEQGNALEATEARSLRNAALLEARINALRDQ